MLRAWFIRAICSSSKRKVRQPSSKTMFRWAEARCSATRSTELVAGENAVVSHYMIEREAQEAFNISTLRIQQDRSANVSRTPFCSAARWCATTCTRCWQAKGGECLINGLFIGDGKQHLDNYMLRRACQPALRQPAVLQRHPRRPSPRRLPRPHHRPQRCAEDRRQADQPQPVALRRRADRHQAATGNLRRRREVHSRRDDRPDRGERAVLPALPRHRRGFGAQTAVAAPSPANASTA